MSIIVRAYSEVDGQIAEASSVNRVIDDLYTEINGLLNSANLRTSGVDTINVNTSAITTNKIDNSAVTAGKIAQGAITGDTIDYIAVQIFGA